MFCSLPMKILQTAKDNLISAGSKISGKAYGYMAAASAAAMPFMLAFAAPENDVFDKVKALLQTIFNGLVGITTAIAVVAAVIACIFMMFSNNPRTVETAKSWLKRIIVAWVIINGLGLIVTWLSGLMDGAGYTFT